MAETLAEALARLAEQFGWPCEKCGTHFLPKRIDAAYCSGRCRVAAWRERSPEPLRACEGCGVTRTPLTGRWNRWCPKCKANRQKHKLAPERACVICTRPFMPADTGRKRYCCDGCAAVGALVNERKKQERRRRKRRAAR